MNIKMIKYLSNELLKVYLKYKMLVRVIWQLAKCICKTWTMKFADTVQKIVVYSTRNLWLNHSWNYRVLNLGIKQAIVIATVKCRYAYYT